MKAKLDRPRFYTVSLQEGHTCCVVTDENGLRLEADSAGPFSFDSPDGSIGRLRLPRGFAIDKMRRCYFAEIATGTIWFFDPRGPRIGARPFSPVFKLPTRTSTPDAWSLAVNSDSLFVIRPGFRELATISLRHWAIQECHGFPNGEGPIDVATYDDHVYVLTDSRIFLQGKSGTWTQFETLDPKHSGPKSRLLIDVTGKIYVHVGKEEWYDVESKEWFLAKSLANFPTNRSHKFPVPKVIAIPHGKSDTRCRYIIPREISNSVTSACRTELVRIELPPELMAPSVTREMLSNDRLDDGFLIREDGVRLRAFENVTKRLFSTGTLSESHDKCGNGSVWFSGPVDSSQFRCQWDRIELSLYIPAGCQVTALTTTHDPNPNPNPNHDHDHDHDTDPKADHLADDYEIIRTDETRWSLGGTFVSGPEPATRNQWREVSFPVRSLPGRFLFLRVQLRGDGFSTPVIHQILARGPRQSHVDFLPAIMRQDDLSRDFLERFIGAMQLKWDQIEGSIDQMNRRFDPDLVRPEHVHRLASWIGISLPVGWTTRQCQDFMKEAPQLMMERGNEQLGRIGGTRRGTVEHLRRTAGAILRGLTQLDQSQMRGFPWVIEGHRERNQLRLMARQDLSVEDRLTAPEARVLWGPGSTGAIRLGENSVLGERQILPSVQSELELYRTYAHRIRVVVPACWLSSTDDERVLKEMLDAEKPAHVACDLKLVRAGLCVGLQSTVGVDTIIGDWPQAVLASRPSTFEGLGQGLTLGTMTNPLALPLTVDGVLGKHSL